ncbi:MAG TPA: hypothetical protein VHO25_16120, partial [Polyangiaceae bacterium]|nr:hypothetical protein [Polyangiaceae bacterium]
MNLHPELLLAILLAACTSTAATAPCPVQVTVSTEVGAPVSGATLRVNDRDVGITNATGELHFASNAPEGSMLSLSVRCPSGFEAVGAPIPVALRRLTALAGSNAPPALRQRLLCRSTEQTSVVVISTDQPALLVLLDGTPRTTTNSDGIAHIALRGKPDTTFEITLDTSTHPELRPQSPSRHFTLGKTAEIVGFQ